MIVPTYLRRCPIRGLRRSSKCSRPTNIAQATLVSGVEFLTRRRTSSDSNQAQAPPYEEEALVAASHLVDTTHSPEDYAHGSAVIYENFITPEEGEALASDLKARLKR